MNKKNIGILAFMLMLLVLFGSVSINGIISGVLLIMTTMLGLSTMMMTIIAGLHIYEYQRERQIQ